MCLGLSLSSSSTKMFSFKTLGVHFDYDSFCGGLSYKLHLNEVYLILIPSLILYLPY